MSVLRGRIGSNREGYRLSLLRVVASLVALVGVCAMVVGAVAAPWLFAKPTGATTAERWFGGYYDVTLDSGQALASSTLGEAKGNTVLSFIVAAAPDDCTPSWGISYDLDRAASELQLDRRIERLQRDGREVVVSFGGAINSELASACDDVDALVEAYDTVLSRYDVDAMDLDIEGDNLSDTVAAERRAAAVAELQREREQDGDTLDVWVTLPVSADFGLTEEGVAAVEALLDGGVELAGVNVMTMNYNSDLGGRSMGEAATDALEATAAQVTEVYGDHEIALPDGGVWALLGATPMIGRNDVTGEIFTLDDAALLNTFATEQGLARMSMWSLNRDRTCGSNYSNDAVVSNECSGIEQAGSFFSDVLSLGFDEVEPAPSPNAVEITDDPETAPYPVWTSTTYYSSSVTVVWRGGVYISKWWVDGGAEPNDPSISAAASAWTYIGPVLDTDVPFSLPQLPEGTYPEWDAAQLYQQGDKVMYEGTGYEAKWWSRDARPNLGVLDRDYSPWTMLTE